MKVSKYNKDWDSFQDGDIVVSTLSGFMAAIDKSSKRSIFLNKRFKWSSRAYLTMNVDYLGEYKVTEDCAFELQDDLHIASKEEQAVFFYAIASSLRKLRPSIQGDCDGDEDDEEEKHFSDSLSSES